MRKFVSGAAVLAAIFAFTLAVPANAQTVVHAKAAPGATRTYDPSKEVTLKGTVASFTTKPSAGMMMGAHLIVATPSGTVNGQLGVYAARGKNPVSFTPGQSVEMVGVNYTAPSGKRVFLVRTVTSGSHVYAIRNAHGFLIRPSTKPVQGGQ